MRLQNNYHSIIIILIITIIGYWQISFLFYGLKWDLIDVVLPFRYYFSECINSGYFPFWNPYQQTGTPFYADLQAPTYYPELFIISLLGRYGIYTMHVLFIVYLFIAAIGMYKLSFYFNQSRNASLIASLSYVFCGYVVGHGQHFFLLVGAAWIPFVVLYYIKLNQENKLINCIKSSVFVFLLITGAYQAISIAMLYLLLLIFAYFFISALSKKNWMATLKILKLNLFFFLIVILLSLPLIISTLEILNFIERLNSGVSLESTLAFGQPCSTFLSFIIPFSTLKYSEFFGNIDSSLINHYFGIIPLIFLVISLFRKHSVLEYIILGFGVIIFSMSFDFLPVRKFIHQHIPLMNLFLSAAYIRIYGLLAFILISAKYFSHFEKNISKERNKLIITGFMMFLVLVALIIFSMSKLTFHDFQEFFQINYVIELFKELSFYQNILIQALFHTFIVGVFIVTIIFYRKIKYPISIITLLIATELFFATQLNMHATVIDMQHKPRDMHDNLSLSPKGFPIPVNDKILFNDQQHAFFEPFWRNTYIFTKQVSFNAFSSFELKTYSKLDDKYNYLRSATLNNHLAYFSDTILPLAIFNDTKIAPEHSKYLFLSQQDYNLLAETKVKTDSSDLINIKEFSPNTVVLETKTKNDQFLTLLQTNYKGWKAYIDGKETPIYTSNFNYRTILLPKGEHVVKFEYKNLKIIIFYVLSNIIFFCCILFLMGRWLYLKHKGTNIYLYIPLTLIFLILFLIIARFIKKQTSLDFHAYYNARFSKENAYMSETHNFENLCSNYDTLTVFSGDKSFVVDSSTEFLPIIELVQNNNNKIKEGTLKVTFKLFTNNYNKSLIVSEINNKWHAHKIEKQIEGLNKWNDILYLRRIPKMDKGEILKTYLWNPNKSKFIIDSISVELFE